VHLLILSLLCLLAVVPEGLAEWRTVSVPAGDGFSASDPVWYRCHIRVPDRMVTPAAKDLWRDSMMLGLSDLPGPFEVLLGGVSIITCEGVPVGTQRRFKIPKGMLQKGVFNALVIRLESGSLTKAPVYFGYHHELVLGKLWQVSDTEPTVEDHQALTEQPMESSYVESEFRPASTVLDSTIQPSPGKRVPPSEALALLQTDDDLAVDDVLHEPEVTQPTHLSFDGRGRMWVAQYRQYPFPAGLKMISRDMYYRSKYDRVPPAPPNHDRGADIISVHEDADGDGIYESHKRAIEGLNMANAVVHGHGGIWVMQTPYLLFYPDGDGDDVPDRDPEVRLAGFGLEDTHSVANGLVWGPEGWLYGAQGSTTTSRVTRPGIDAEGVYNEGCMVWRYHPQSRDYEIFADGSGNTFGLSFDAEGRLFSGHNGGVTRGWHHIQEGLYLKQGKNPGKFGPPPNPYAFGEMPMMQSTHPVPRFSHMPISIDGVAMPARLRGQFLGVDPLHHHLVASERHLEGSTFSTTDRGFPLRTEDETFRPVYLANSPDGAITVADFREEYIAHGQNYQGQIDPDSGRIYRLRGKTLPLVKDRNLEAKTSLELVRTLEHENLWHRQTAVRLLAERSDESIVADLLDRLAQPSSHPALEALWTLHQMGKFDQTIIGKALQHPAPMVRAWVIRLAGDAKLLTSETFEGVLELARREPDAEVRSQILSTARRLPAGQALLLVRSIAVRTEDFEDAFIPLMAWFTIESHCAENSDAVMALFAKNRDLWTAPFSQTHLLPRTMRRFASTGSHEDFLICARLFGMASNKSERMALLLGFEQAFEGRALPELPDELATALAAAGKGSLAFRIRAGEPDAITEAMRLLEDGKAATPNRIMAARAFGARTHLPAMASLLNVAVGAGDLGLRRSAMVALQTYDDDTIGARIAKEYAVFPSAMQPTALSLLASRPEWAVALLNEANIPATVLDADLLDRLRLHQDDALSAILTKRFPEVADDPSPDLGKRIAEIRAALRGAPGDPYQGEPIFAARCASCHMLFHKGGKIGPDLTSYQREDLSTLLPSVIAPSVDIREGFENYLVKTKGGRALGGFLSDQGANAITIRGFDGSDISILRSEIAELLPAGRSLMPDGLLGDLDDQQLRDFFAYLRIPQPISP
jgi:putative heme-binding domain-containing protein